MAQGGLKFIVALLLLVFSCNSLDLQAVVPAGIADALRARAASQGPLRLIVQLQAPQLDFGKLDQAARQSRFQVIDDLQTGLLVQLRHTGLRELARFKTIPFMVVLADAQTLEALVRLPQVISIQEDIPEPPTLASSVPIIGAPAAWTEGFEGTGQAVAVLDTGVDTGHAFFPPGKVVAEACFSTTFATDKSTSVCPGGAPSSTASGSGTYCPLSYGGCDHGTHVAGIAVGNDGVGPNIGVAPDAQLIPIQVFSVFGSGAGGCAFKACSYPSDQVKALEHILILSDTIDIAAVNMSLGGALFASQSSCDAANELRKAAIDNLRAVGIATIIASGNNSGKVSLSQPGCISSAISVGNTTDADEIAASSNVSTFLSLLAPGTDINSAYPGGGLKSNSGTSMAAPHVAGAWAVLREAEPLASVDEILAALRLTGTSVDDQRSGGSVTDMRRINLDLALDLLQQPRPEYSSIPAASSILDLGNIPVGSSGTVFDLAVSNLGDADLTMNCAISGAQAAHFVLTQCPGLIVAAASADISLRCDPSLMGDLSATLVVTSNDIRAPELNYSLQCVGLDVEIDTTPVAGTVLDFSAVLVNTQSPVQGIQVDNSGNLTSSLSCNLSGDNPAQFSITACPANVPAAGQAMVSVVCSPTGAGIFAAMLEITSDDTDEGLLNFPLACSGATAEINSDPVTGSSLDFGITVVGMESAGQFINLSNSGDGALLLSCDLVGANPDSFRIINCPASIAAGNQIDLELRCQPDATGTLAVQLQISSNDEDEPLLGFDLACQGVAPKFEPDPVAGSSFDFGRVYLGEPGPVYQLTVQNPGTSPLALLCEITGDAAVDYAIVLCPVSVASGQSETVKFECIPLTEGVKLAQLHLTTDDTNDPEAFYNLSCDAAIRPEMIFRDGFEDVPPP